MCLTTKIISKKLFQFHKGTIRTGKEYFGMLYDNNFNSIKVRLEQLIFCKFYLHKKFQFHKGTIRTFSRRRVYAAESKSQFHKGTIRTSRVQLKQPD